jgi:hypothetical protein
MQHSSALGVSTGAAQRRQPCQPVNWRVNALTVSTLFFMTCGWRSFARLPPALLFSGRKDPRIRQAPPRSNYARQCSVSFQKVAHSGKAWTYGTGVEDRA